MQSGTPCTDNYIPTPWWRISEVFLGGGGIAAWVPVVEVEVEVGAEAEVEGSSGYFFTTIFL